MVAVDTLLYVVSNDSRITGLFRDVPPLTCLIRELGQSHWWRPSFLDVSRLEAVTLFLAGLRA